MEKFYFNVGVYGDGIMGHHIIKATSEENALQIREKHGISNPWGAKGVLRITCEKLDLRYIWNKERIERRKRGIGGFIWMEDADGNLQKEI